MKSAKGLLRGANIERNPHIAAKVVGDVYGEHEHIAGSHLRSRYRS